MAAGPSPVQAMMAQALMQRLAAARAGGGGSPDPGTLAMGAGAPPGGAPAGGPQGSPQDMATAAAFQRELSSLRQADPMAMAKAIQTLRQQVTQMISQAGMSIPGVSRAMAKCLQPLDAAFKEAQTAAATTHLAASGIPGSGGPIQASAAQGTPGMGGSAPSPGPSMGGM
jgi:hypothetical protein